VELHFAKPNAQKKKKLEVILNDVLLAKGNETNP